MASVFARSDKMSVVSVVVPDIDECTKLLPQFKDNADENGINRKDELFNHLNKALVQVLSTKLAEDLMPHEIPKGYLAFEGPWTPESGLLTPTFKTKGKAIQQKYQADIDKLFESLP